MVNKINTTLNDVFRSTPLGDVSSAVGNALYGINHRMTPGMVPINRDFHGFTFFTRPQLNLTDGNVSALRQLVPLLTTQPLSIQRMVRELLDPRIDSASPIVDSKSAFIPILTNHMLSMSGWPDFQVDTHTSKPGVYREEFTYVDSIIERFQSFNMSVSFRNMVSDPIMLIITVWLEYMTAVFRGDMMPYPDFLAANEMDYNTRIYRVVLDKNKRLVQKIACTGGSFPVSAPIGASFNWEHDRPRNEANDQLQINFRNMGYRYQDHLVIKDFNNVVGIFNPDMREDVYQNKMINVPQAALQAFNNRGYPRIDPDTLELQWWVSEDQYQATITAYQRNFEAVGGQGTVGKPYSVDF